MEVDPPGCIMPFCIPMNTDSPKHPEHDSSRRRFLRHTAVAAGGTATSTWAVPKALAQPQNSAGQGSAAVTPPAPGPMFCLFTKHLLGMKAAALADHVASLGFGGIEAPIRPGGHIEPEAVPDQLPVFVEILKKDRLELSILTSGINEVSPGQFTERVLRTAANLGIRWYRLNWFQYDLKKALPPQLLEIRAKMKDLIALSKELGIRPLSQNHNGRNYVGAAIWDLESVMREFAPEDWGFAYDIMHGTVVGGTSWQTGCQLALSRPGAAYFKDFRWAGRLQPGTCPLGTGMAAAPEFAALLKQSGFKGPISLHIEYLKAQKITTPAEAVLAHEAAGRDFAQLQQWWAK